MTETDETPRPADVAGRLDGLVVRLRIAALDGALPIGEAWNLLDEAADAIEHIFNKLDYKTKCPCCSEHVQCQDGCTFAFDSPDDYERMVQMRGVLTPNTGNHGPA